MTHVGVEEEEIWRGNEFTNFPALRSIDVIHNPVRTIKQSLRDTSIQCIYFES